MPLRESVALSARSAFFKTEAGGMPILKLCRLTCAGGDGQPWAEAHSSTTPAIRRISATKGGTSISTLLTLSISVWVNRIS